MILKHNIVQLVSIPQFKMSRYYVVKLSVCQLVRASVTQFRYKAISLHHNFEQFGTAASQETSSSLNISDHQSESAMWIWSDFYCDNIHPVGEDYEDQIWISYNNTRVYYDGAADSGCVSDGGEIEQGWIMDPRNVQDSWVDYGEYRRHRWKDGYGCLHNGSCVYVENRTKQTDDLFADVEFNTTNIFILVLGCVISLVTILGNSIVNMKSWV